MKETFADSFYFLALFNPADNAHDRALAAARTISGLLVTTDWVLAEVADALSDPVNRSGCVRLIEDLGGRHDVIVTPASRDSFAAGWRLYRERPDKGWSLTDCISFAIMEQRGIDEALTGDRHFEQAGFRAALKD